MDNRYRPDGSWFVFFLDRQKYASVSLPSILRWCSPETCHQDPGFTYGMGKRPLGRADKVKPSPQQTAPDAGPKLANMEEKWSFKQ